MCAPLLLFPKISLRCDFREPCTMRAIKLRYTSLNKSSLNIIANTFLLAKYMKKRRLSLLKSLNYLFKDSYLYYSTVICFSAAQNFKKLILCFFLTYRRLYYCYYQIFKLFYNLYSKRYPLCCIYESVLSNL